LSEDTFEDFLATHAASGDSSEYYIVSDSPNASTHDDNYFHKEAGVNL
jgi:hypothetical protein